MRVTVPLAETVMAIGMFAWSGPAHDLHLSAEVSAQPGLHAGPVTAMVSDARGLSAGESERLEHPSTQVAQGEQIFRVNCAFCHGSEGRGGEGGPNLLRSPLLSSDQNGEVISAVVLNGRVEKGMPKFALNAGSIADIAAYLHARGSGEVHDGIDPKAILVGNADAGKVYFYRKGGCDKCHSVKGDLAGIGSKYDLKTLQDNMVSGGALGLLGEPTAATPPRIVSVTLPSAEVVRGTLIAIDDFNVSLIDDAGYRRSLRRNGDIPHIQVVDPRQAHIDMLRQWDDRDIHNLTAFLAKQK